MPMEDRCEFIWQLIEESPVLSRELHELEKGDLKNQDKIVSGLIDFYRDIDLGIDCLLEAYQKTKKTLVACQAPVNGPFFIDELDAHPYFWASGLPATPCPLRGHGVRR